MDDPIPVGIVDVSTVTREGMSRLLRRQTFIRFVGGFSSAEEVLAQLPVEANVLLLYDFRTARRDGKALLRELQARRPRAKILIFNVPEEIDVVIECAHAGASGCLLQDASLADLLQAIRSVWRNIPVLSRHCITSLFSYLARLQSGERPPESKHLTRREQEILELIAEGLSNKEIARRLYLRPQTVKNYVHLILQKLDLHSRLEVIRLLRSGMKTG
jgi:DNA-binding NarL/FixJ family response regulator